MRAPCSEPGCDRFEQFRGMCSMHYRRWHRSEAFSRVNLTKDEALAALRKILPAKTETVQKKLGVGATMARNYLRMINAFQRQKGARWYLPTEAT